MIRIPPDFYTGVSKFSDFLRTWNFLYLAKLNPLWRLSKILLFTGTYFFFRFLILVRKKGSIITSIFYILLCTNPWSYEKKTCYTSRGIQNVFWTHFMFCNVWIMRAADNVHNWSTRMTFETRFFTLASLFSIINNACIFTYVCCWLVSWSRLSLKLQTHQNYRPLWTENLSTLGW